MSRRTKSNKRWAKIARGEDKSKAWKDTLPSYYQTKTTTTKHGKVYESIVPYWKGPTAKSNIHKDMVGYLRRIFGGLF